MKTIIYLEFGRDSPYYILDDDLGISKEELWLNIWEQIYGDILK